MKNLITLLSLILMLQLPAFADENMNPEEYNVVIAVSINESTHILGKLEYTNVEPLYPLQLVSFTPVAGTIYTQAYVFEVLQKNIIELNYHQIKCRTLNDTFGGNILHGSIDFRDISKPKIKLVTERGHTYISNISSEGKKMKSKYIPEIWLGR